ncbi:MAG: alpha/beta hydrolase [Alphaproteobacteria bacterium]
MQRNVFNGPIDKLPCQSSAYDFGPFIGIGKNTFQQLRQALAQTAKAMVAAKISPACLSTMVWIISPKAAQELRDQPRRTDLIFREVFGGNYPALDIREENGLGAVTLSATAAVSSIDSRYVYRQFTRSELDRAYSARAAVPEHLEILSTWHERSEVFRSSRVAERITLTYGSIESQKIDLYLPTNRQALSQDPLPIHIFFHGGYWQALSKEEHGFLADSFVKEGIAFIAVDYSLCPAVTLGEIYREVRTALLLIAKQAARYGLRTRRWQVGGHSAGAQLAALLATDQEVGPLISSLVLLSGIYDLEPLRYTNMNRVLDLDEVTIARQSPLGLLPVHPLNIVMTVGDKESGEFHRQSADFAMAWQKLSCKIMIIPSPGSDHFTVLELLSDPQTPLFKAAKSLF